MTASAKLAPPTVLVVDDHADSRALFRRLMESLGYAVAEAGTARRRSRRRASSGPT